MGVSSPWGENFGNPLGKELSVVSIEMEVVGGKGVNSAKRLS